ncbi:hypothetical protein GBA65_20120 [Rubrobacter marinus]|uniref:Uncharacterized protein n=1 Tax=Rubrobacter marinus TaxID=2653852 RepID=A0A6G8Q294_9ACTN|nr:hypothetical protein [Rubrobacter marinus]QIN80437.1 hypothetical protein GBA65_20120 [Rubrobacter marinus]
MERTRTASFGTAEERIAWEGLASSCVPPLRRLGAFMIFGFTVFVATTTAVVLFYNIFGARLVEGQGVAPPPEAFYASMAVGLVLGLGGYAVWLLKSLSSHKAFSRVLRRGGLDPERPTAQGLKAYSDEQLLALRSRYENLGEGRLKTLMEKTFGFDADDSFSLGPLSVLPRTFEMDALRVEWEANLILASGAEARPEISWWTESRHNLLPRRADEMRRLLFALQYTKDSVRTLKRRYGYRSDHWHNTVPEGKLWDAVRDLEEARRIQAVLNRRPGVR